MAEKRSIPAALGIFIGPAIAYLSYLILSSGLSEYLQLVCFGLFFLTGHDLAASRISLSGGLAILLLPAIPIAIYVNQAVMLPGNHLSPMMIIAFWVASALLGAIWAGMKPPVTSGSANVRRLAISASALFILVAATFMV
ncbi:MAG: hypothetical protein GY726_00140 [Proteobacteria bacterium]|nr:hypothetical protein [Pseudomonadota bacterium]